MIYKIIQKCRNAKSKPTKMYFFGYEIEDLSAFINKNGYGEIIASSDDEYEQKILRKGELQWKL